MKKFYLFLLLFFLSASPAFADIGTVCMFDASGDPFYGFESGASSVRYRIGATVVWPNDGSGAPLGKDGSIDELITALEGIAGPHTIYIAKGKYNDVSSKIQLDHANLNGATIQGTRGHGITDPPDDKWNDVQFASNPGYNIDIATDNTTIRYFKAYAMQYTNAADIGLAEYIKIVDGWGVSDAFESGGDGIIIRYSRFQGKADGDYSFRVESGDLQLEYSIVGPSAGKLVGQSTANDKSAVQIEGGSSVTMYNCDVTGYRNRAINVTGNSYIWLRNNYMGGGGYWDDGDSCVINVAAGSVINHDYNIYVGSWDEPQDPLDIAGTNIDGGNNQYAGTGGASTLGRIGIKRHNRTGIITLSLDDAIGGDGGLTSSYAAQLFEVWREYGLKGSWLIDYKNYDRYHKTDVNAILNEYASYSNMRPTGTIEVVCHQYVQQYLSMEQTGSVVQAPGISHATDNIDINRGTDTITVNPAGTVANFRTKDLDDIKTELEILGCTVPTWTVSYVTGIARGEIMDDTPAGNPIDPQIKRDDYKLGLYKAEMWDPKNWLESDLTDALGTGVSVWTYAPWGGARDTDTVNAAMVQGFHGMRGRAAADESWNAVELAGISVFGLHHLQPHMHFGALSSSEADIKAYARTMAESACEMGLILNVITHFEADISIQEWRWILDVWTEEYADCLTVTSIYDAVQTIINGPYWSVDASGNSTFTRAWSGVTGYELAKTSGLIDAGTNDRDGDGADDTGYTDLRGRGVPQNHTTDIGAYESRQRVAIVDDDFWPVFSP